MGLLRNIETGQAIKGKPSYERQLNFICRGEMECLSGDCLPEQKMCDGRNDCIDGRDESVNLCMKLFKSGHFQCANGNLIEKKKICDNIFDCPDGSDELLKFCVDNKDWIRNPPKTCVEPTERGLRFTYDTKYHLANGTRFVYANQGVVFECYDRNAKIIGSKWNVCLYTGEWKNPQIECQSKPVNNNPNTNGTNGCPINTYVKDLLLIYKCVDGNCLTRVEPPINDMRVQFACAKGYLLTPLGFGEKILRCLHKQWDSNNVYFTDPVCKKPCNRINLYCSDSMYPRCEYNGIENYYCNGTLLPGTKAIYFCNYGYIINPNMSKLQLECLDDGNWLNSKDMDKFCQLNCGTTGGDKNQLSKSTKAPWTTALYKKIETSFEYVCSGVRLKPNIVLTAAHCVVKNKTKELLPFDFFRVGNSRSNLRIIHEHFGWAVEDVILHWAYLPEYLNGDIALLKLKYNTKDVNEGPCTICLPWAYNNHMTEIDKESGLVFSWKKHDSTFLNLTLVSTNIEEKESDGFRINILNNQKICSGDSGSGFGGDCFDEQNQKTNQTCVYGVVSYTNTGMDNYKCAKNIVVLDIRHAQNMDFLKETIKKLSKTCEDSL
nr:modular serine protease-like [Drosophila virilis]